MQKPVPGDAAASGNAFGEDCLFVNVWRPAAVKRGEALPVLVWIHGGGFLNGGSSAPMFDGSALARQGLVVVSLNYRLGRLGFFMHPALAATGEQALGNYGFLDQRAAIKWVRRNISAFGGDAHQVTLIGTTGDDLPVLFPPRDNPLSFFGAEAAAAKAVYFPDGTDPTTSIKNIAVDITMHEPARFVAKQVTAAGQPAWLYRFGYVAESQRPKGTAEHAKELPYLFATLNVRYGEATTSKDRSMSDVFISYFAAFAKTGDPNRSGLLPWPRYDPAKSELMMFTPDAAAVMQPDPWKSRLDLIEHATEAQTAAVPPSAGARRVTVTPGDTFVVAN